MSSSLTETGIIPYWAKKKGLTRCFFYNGLSMVPTFRPGHLVYVRPNSNDVGPGDIIVFSDPLRDSHIVHRIISASPEGFITRGDNNRRYDLPVSPDRLVGRVEMVEDRGRLKPVRGGNIGLWWARMRWGVLRVDRGFRRALWAPYDAVRRSPSIRRFLGRRFSRQLGVVRLETPDGPLFKTTFKGRTVAQWWPHLNRFHCRKPFDLFISHPKVSD